MNWDAVGALAEAVGAAGVIATLAYLAIQIRRSNLLATAESNRFSHNASSPTVLAIAQDPELARIFREGLGDRDSLSADDRVRFDMVVGTLISGLSATITDQDLLGHRSDLQGDQAEALRAFLLAPGGASWWADYQARFAPGVRARIEEKLGIFKPPAAERAGALGEADSG
jgi:hypothetical protein